MRILQMVDVPWNSGLANYCLTLSEGLQKKGHSVFVSALPGEKPWHRAQKMGLQTIPYISIKTLRPLRAFLKKNRIQIMNAHTGSTHSLAVAASLGQGIAVIRTRSDARHITKRLGTPFLYGRTQRVIAAADYIRHEFVDVLGIPTEKVKTVYQGIDLGTWPHQPHPKKVLFGIVARLDPVKGHVVLLKALRELGSKNLNVHVMIVGKDENISRKMLEQIVDQYGLGLQVSFYGYQEDVKVLMKKCTVGVIASLGSEAVSRVALEWMALGRPVISTRVGCLPELINPGKNGILIRPNSVSELASALESCHDLNVLQKMGLNARKTVESKFSFEDFISNTELVYREAISCLN